MTKKDYTKERDEILNDIYSEEKIVKSDNKKRQLNDNSIVIFTIFLGIAALFIGMFQMRGRVRNNIFNQYDQNVNIEALLSQNNNDLEDLFNKDTDNDGLSDYEEIYIYFTSPYLEDSDSDGISDFDEVRNNTDPNCPEGKVCRSLEVDENPTGTESLDKVKTESLRDTLIQLGVPGELIAEFNEEELGEVYNMLMSEFAASEGEPGSPAVPSLEDLEKMEFSDLKELLSSWGVDPKMLEGISKDELIKLIKESL